MITLKFISHPAYTQHFEQNGDTLSLYLPAASLSPDALQLRENREAMYYELTLDSISYVLPKGLNGIIPLQKP